MKTRPLCFMCLLFLSVQSILFVLAGGNSDLGIPASSIFREEDGKSISIQGQIYKKSYTSNSQILYLKNNSVTDSKLLIYDKNFIEAPIGKKIWIRGTTIHFEHARNPGNFDQALYYARQGIYGAIRCEEVEAISGKTKVFMNGLYECKAQWKEKLMIHVGEKNGAILSAMLLGEKSEMDGDLKELYQKNGIGHILAISGLHISFIGLGIYHILRKAGLNYFFSGIIGVGVLSIYVLMLGFSTSVFRAYIMLLFKIGADMTGRKYDMPTALLVSAALMIGYQPMYLTDAGFYLSYGAIGGIIWVLPALKRMVPYRKKWFSGIYTSLAVNVALLPVLLWYYFEFPIYSIFLNLIVIPLMSVLLELGMAGSFLLLWLEPLGEICLMVCGWILEFFEMLGQIGVVLPEARLILGQPKLWTIVVYYALLIFLVIYINFKQGKKRHLCLVLIGMCLLVCYRPKGDVQITMLDVGQGDGICIQGPKGNNYFIDGGSSDVKQVGKNRIEPYLKSQGVECLDYVFVTHGDTDHYSGIEEMLGRQKLGVRIKTLVLPCEFSQDEALVHLAKLAQRVGTQVTVIKEGSVLQEGELHITCLQPSEEDNLSGNAGSMVLDISYEAFRMLCTGDVEGEGERKLLGKLKGKDYNVLKVAHHGSKNSTSDRFLNQIKAEIALISAGKGNSYGHPHKETMERLQKVNCHIYETEKTGAITLRIRGNSLTISLLPYRL